MQRIFLRLENRQFNRMCREGGASFSNDALSSKHLTALKLDDAIACNQEVSTLEFYYA